MFDSPKKSLTSLTHVFLDQIFLQLIWMLLFLLLVSCLTIMSLALADRILEYVTKYVPGRLV
jgi:hypothetical protein